MKKVEAEDAPRELKLLIITANGSFDDLVSRIEELEEYDIWVGTRRARDERNHSNKRTPTVDLGGRERKADYDDPARGKREIKCYKCGKTGHIRINCPNYKRKGNVLFLKEELSEDKSMRRIQLNG
ncbi:hypothetical protein GINT2_001206 [Glugoides intestinalis]